MKLIERRPGDLPMRLFVEVAQSHGVGQQQVQLLGHFQTHVLFQLQWQRMRNRPIGLDLSSALVKAWLRGNSFSGGVNFLVRHKKREPPDLQVDSVVTAPNTRSARDMPASSSSMPPLYLGCCFLRV